MSAEQPPPGRPGGEGPRRLEDEQIWRALREGLDAFSSAGSGGAESPHEGGQRCLELCPICRAADLVRATAPPELRGQLSDLQRELLLTVRAMIDHYLERADSRPRPGRGVEEIPIE
jgi:hypothetical protein